MKIETVKHADVRGKELLYLKLTGRGNNEPYLINVGEKTFKQVSDMLNEEHKSSDEIKKIVGAEGKIGGFYDPK